MPVLDRDRILDQRLATQRLTSTPLASPADVVQLLTCVQAQERDHAFFSLGLRTRRATFRSVRAALDAGEILRTHILRPTWHFVRPADLRWILALTSPRVEPGMSARHRQLGLDDVALVDRSFRALAELLAGRTALTRAEIGSAFEERRQGLPEPGERLGHLLLVAELRGLICSGPTNGTQHSYLLVDEIVPPAAPLDRDDALRRLVHRFFAGHGPASVADFVRWSSLTGGDAKRALAELSDELVSDELDGVRLYWDPAASARRSASASAAWLFPVYDEVVLTYAKLGFPPARGHPHVTRPDPFWGWVVHGHANVGLWKRTVTRDGVGLDLRLASSLDRDGRAAVDAAADRLARFLELPRTS